VKFFLFLKNNYKIKKFRFYLSFRDRFAPNIQDLLISG